jgi:hypothetical protein
MLVRQSNLHWLDELHLSLTRYEQNEMNLQECGGMCFAAL